MSSQRRMSSPAGACWTTTYCCATMLLLMKEVTVIKLQRCECFFRMAQVDLNPNQSWRLRPKAQRVIVLCLFSVCVGSITKHLKKKKKEKSSTQSLCVVGCKKSPITSFASSRPGAVILVTKERLLPLENKSLLVFMP